MGIEFEEVDDDSILEVRAFLGAEADIELNHAYKQLKRRTLQKTESLTSYFLQICILPNYRLFKGTEHRCLVHQIAENYVC